MLKMANKEIRHQQNYSNPQGTVYITEGNGGVEFYQAPGPTPP